MYVYLLVDTTPFELPIAVFDSARECAEWISVPVGTLRQAYRRGSVIRGFCRCYRVKI